MARDAPQKREDSRRTLASGGRSARPLLGIKPRISFELLPQGGPHLGKTIRVGSPMAGWSQLVINENENTRPH